MARGGKAKKKEEGEEEANLTNPETIERKRLKSLAISHNILSETPARSSVQLNPSSVVAKHHGKDIIKKSQRKSSRYLFSFPGLIAPIAGGKIGDLKDLGTKNPVLYLDFPQGQMKLFGTIVYPKNRYLTLQFPKGGKSVMCEDYFDNMIVFSDAWWIGRKEENPEEAKLEFPKELYEGHQSEYDFKGGAGAGAASVVNQGVPRTKIQRVEQESPKTPTEDDLSDSEINLEDTKELVPVRHSTRTAKKSYKFAEISSGDDSGENSPDLSDHEEKVAEVDTAVNDHNSSKKKTVVFDLDDEDDAPVDQPAKKNNESASRSKCKEVSQSASASASTEIKSSNRGSLVQATISTLFKKVEEKLQARSHSLLVQKERLIWMKDPKKGQERPRTKILVKKSRRKARKTMLKMMMMVTLKNFQMLRRILMKVMKTGLLECVI
ncbi:DNA-binding protein RHL1-like isoform X3 [Glycine soja]|uniref:DNA-binding protein RHL1-like isoform X3 n=1 Tax=Glycine soja TaxID=3848 RepID=UPI00103DF6CD|nr:DNA-binding protein RHL1-like isoform X3 [Glycine soja]